MSDPSADSTGEPGEATGEPMPNGVGSDSTPAPAAAGQEQGDQSESKRLRGLMSALGSRTTERDQALAELDALKAQLVERELEAQAGLLSSFDPATMEAAEGEDEGVDDEGEDYEPPPRMDHNSAVRPEFRQQPSAPSEPSTPASRYARDSADIAALQAQLRAAGAQWYEGQKEQGLID